MSEKNKLKFYIYSEYGELLDLALYLQNVEGHEVVFGISDQTWNKIGENMVEKDNNWYNYLGKGYIFLIDGCAHGNMQDWLRSQGEAVFGGSEEGDELENNRQKGQEFFKAAGFEQPKSKNFTDIDEALKFVEANKDKRWILKQNMDAPKHLNHMGKFDSSEDMIYHLQELQKSWSETEFGKFDCDLMEVVDGLEVAASVFFNGKEFMKNSDGKVVGYLNFEEKKEIDGNLGETTGEMGTTFSGVTEDNDLFKNVIMRPYIIETLRKLKFRGVFDINGCITNEGYVAFEPTMRFGIPTTSYVFIEGMNSNTGEMLEAVAKGINRPIEINEGVGMVMVLAAKPYPVESDVADEATSIGERLWILKDGALIDDFTAYQRKHIHLYNFFKQEDTGYYKVATKSGYLLVISGRNGTNISKVRENLIQYIKENIYLSGNKFRSDIGKRIEEYFSN